MGKKIKILFFIFDLGGGGAEKVLVNLVNNLDPDKYDITIKTLFAGGINQKRLKPYITFNSIIKKNPIPGITKIFRLFPPSFLYSLFIKEKYDIEIAYLQHIPTRILGGDKNHKCKKFAWIHIVSDSSRHLLNSYKSEKEFNKIYNSFDKIAFVSKEALETFSLYYKVGSLKEVVHNVNEYNNLKELANQNVNINLKEGTINLIAIGRLCSQKRFDRLINALNFLESRNISNWNLYILGEGDDQEKLQAQINDFNLGKKIFLLGFQENPYKYLSKMDLFVCSSQLEGYSTAATEAIYLGIPIITTDCGGMHDIIGNSNAGLIVENSQDGLNEGLYRVLNEPKLLHLLKEGAKKRSEDFSTSAGIKEFEDFINN